MDEKNEQPVEEKAESKKSFGFKKWLEGESKKDYAENLSIVIIIVSGIMVAMGVGLGSFIQGTILLGILGAFFAMLGIVIYILSQFIEV